MTNCNKIIWQNICFLKFPTYTSQFYESPKSNNSGWGETIRHWWGELSETNLHFFVAVFVSISILIRTIRRISISKCPFLKISISIGTFLDILISIRKTCKIRYQFQRTGDDVLRCVKVAVMEEERILRVFPIGTSAAPTSFQLLPGNSLRRKTWVSLYSVPRYRSPDNVSLLPSTFQTNGIFCQIWWEVGHTRFSHNSSSGNTDIL